MPALIRESALLHPTKAQLVDAVLWAVLVLPFILMLSLLLTLASISIVHAADGACAGRNLMDEMRQSAPDHYEAIVAEAAKVPNGKGIFWKIEKPGLEPSWLLGTMHVTDPRVLSMPKGAREAFEASSTIVIESDEILDENKASAAILMKPELSMFTDGKSIGDFLSPEEFDRLDAGLQERGIPLAALSKMKPWIIASFIALPACELERKAEGAAFLDKKIAQDAVAAGKDVKGLETLVEQMSAMSALPIEFHLNALIETLALGKKMEDIMYTMTDLYLSGDVGMTMPMLKAAAPSSEDEDSAYADFEQKIVTDRNHVMADRGDPILEKGGVFMAVGALHLPGEEGVVELLRRKGFTVTLVTG